VDRRAIEQVGIPGIVLMENAGRQIAGAAREMLDDSGGKRALILAGGGNNGGDGFVVARHLLITGHEPRVMVIAEPEKISGDARTNLEVLKNLGLTVEALTGHPDEILSRLRPALGEADLVVDGLLGTGTTGEIREPRANVVEAVNSAGKPVLSIDIPSGMDCDTGGPLGACIRADCTVTMVARKVGFKSPAAKKYLGKVIVADIGIAPE
ncbi:MAG: NAD(P)H-hydrate epimerase, partial [Phycisphaerae bacterium]|nr:NAD(P)H-hydrate epimerase [Phycisphaerae bacterium]